MGHSRQRTSQRIGQRFEQSIELEEHGWPVLFKVPTARTKGGRETRKTWLDFVGMLPGGGGRLVTFDAKWIGLSEKVQRSVLSPSQREMADAALTAGALTFVYVGAVGEDGRPGRYVVPWEDLREVGSLGLAPYAVEGLSALAVAQDALDVVEVQR